MQGSNGSHLGPMLIQEGLLIRFSPQTIFGKNTSNHHFGVIVNANHKENNIGLIVGTTSNVAGATSFAALRGMAPETVVVISPGAYPHFGKQTAFNCNDPKQIHMNQLAKWYTAQMIDVPVKNPYIDQALLVDIKNGVYLSDLVEEKVKKLLF